MALKAGYHGIKRGLINKLIGLPAIKTIGTGLSLNSSTGELEATGTTISIEANPEGTATENLIKLGLGDTVYAVPDAAKTYQTDDATESAIADADYIPFLDSSAASGSGAPKKSTWSNFIAKIKAKITEFVTWEAQAVLGAKNLLPNNASNKTDGNVAWVVNADKSITINTSAAASSVQTLQIGELTGLQGDYILNGVTGGSSSTFGIQLYDVTTSTWTTQYAVDGDSIINLADKTHTYRFVAYVREGVEVSNKTIYPMFRLATDTDDTYVPYAMTNKELTDTKVDKVTAILSSSDDLDNIMESGLYNITSKPENSPSQWCTMLVIAGRNDNISQIIFRDYGNSGSIYIRSHGGSPAAWQPWIQFTGTVIS